MAASPPNLSGCRGQGFTETIEDKITALLSHRSQLRTIHGLYGALVRLDARMTARQAGLLYAERFRALSLPPLHREAHTADWSPVVGRRWDHKQDVPVSAE